MKSFSFKSTVHSPFTLWLFFPFLHEADNCMKQRQPLTNLHLTALLLLLSKTVQTLRWAASVGKLPSSTEVKLFGNILIKMSSQLSFKI